MGSYIMFSDLPSINLDYEHIIHRNTHTQNEWHCADPPNVFRDLNAFGLDGSMQPWNRRSAKDAQGLILQECHGRSPYPSMGQYKSQWSQEPREFHSHVEVVAPWASTVFPPAHVHPLSMGPDDRQASDQGSCSGGSTWSPVPSERQYDRGWNNQMDDYKECHVSQTFRPSSTFSNPSVGGSSTSGSGITLQDVQQYPDSCPEEEFENFVTPNGKGGPVYSTDYDIPPRMPYPRENRIRYLESICPTSGDEIAAKDEPMSEEDNDSASDYAPVTRRRHVATRSSRETKHARTPSNGTRKPSTDKHNRISKASKQPIKSSPMAQAGLSMSSKASLNLCPHCSKSLPTKSALTKHVLTTHTRPFSCTFRIYGCPATFGSKNEWKRHVSSQHLRLGIWRCDIGACLPPQHSPDHRHEPLDDSDEEVAIYNDFNRKDLFTQHIRRMHSPPESCSTSEKEAFNASLEATSQRCLMDIRCPPPHSVCGYCTAGNTGRDTVFEGDNAWETRMEHVGRHLESGHGESKRWREDISLRSWMVNEGLIEPVELGRWRLVGLQVEEGKSKRTKK